MLSRCSHFRSLHALLVNRLGEVPKVYGILYHKDSAILTVILEGQDAWAIASQAGTTHVSAASIKELVAHVRCHTPASVDSIIFNVSCGGNSWQLEESLSLSNPEAIATAFWKLFRSVAYGDREHHSDHTADQAGS